MITAEGPAKRYRDTTTDDPSCTVRPGVVTGFLAPNGVGKSTAMRLMLGSQTGRGSTASGGRTYAELVSPVRIVGTLLAPRAAIRPAPLASTCA